MKEQLMSTTRSIGITKPLSSIQLKYIPSEYKMRSSCGFCHTDHDPRLDPNAKEFIPRPPARDVENTAPMFRNNGLPYIVPLGGPWPSHYGSAWWHRRPPGSSQMSTAVPAVESVHMNGGRPNVRGCAAVGAGPPAGNLVKGDCPLACAEPRQVKPPSPPPPAPSDPCPPAAEGQLREELRQLRLKAFQGEAELPLQSPRSDSAAVPPAACVVEINSVSISPPKSDVILSADVPDSPRSADSIVFQSGSLGSDFLERCVVSPSQCSDSTKPRRSSQCRDSTSRDPRPTCRAQSAAGTAVCCPSSPSTSAAGASPECDPAACRGWRRASSGASDSESSDDSSEDDSAASDGEWDGSPAAGSFLPGSSVDSDSDFIQFVREDEPCCPSPLVQPCCPTLPVRPCCPTQPALPLTPVFGPSPGDQVDSGLSVETDSDSDSGAEGDSSDDELSDGDEDESCEPCRSASEGTCAVHQRIAEANRQLEAWCAAPPLHTPRTAKVRFHSGDRLATVHAAPDYDRTIASDLLDQQRQRDRLRVWHQEVERQVAPVLAAVLAPEHRRRVLAQRPELLRGGDS